MVSSVKYNQPFRPSRTSAPQVSPFGDTYTYAGKCASCKRNVFTVLDGDRENEPDPRGFAGPRHSLTTFEEHPGALFCWDCVNEHGHEGWKRCEAIAIEAERATAQAAAVRS